VTHPSQTISWQGHPITLTWIELTGKADPNSFTPITQAYGICFNTAGEILVLDQKGNHTWTLPGGHVEPGETPEQALTREIMEEADVTVKNIRLLGFQQVDDSGSGETPYYQARYVATVDQILPQTPDPAMGRIHERRFVPAAKINDYIKWGITGTATFASATNLSKVTS